MNNQLDHLGQRRQELFLADLLFGLTPEEQAEFASFGPATADEGLQSLAEVIGLLDKARADAGNVSLPADLRERIFSNSRIELSSAAPAGHEPSPTRSRLSRSWAVRNFLRTCRATNRYAAEHVHEHLPPLIFRHAVALGDVRDHSTRS